MGMFRGRSRGEVGPSVAASAADVPGTAAGPHAVEDSPAAPPAPGEYLPPALPPTRAEAMQLPAVVRGRNVICGTVAGLPLRAYRTMSGVTEEVEPPSWSQNPDPRYTRLWTFAQTLDDMLFHGRAFWRVATRYAATGFPATFEYLRLDRVGWYNPRGGTADRYNTPPELGGNWTLTIDGRPVRDQDVVRFDGIGQEGILVWGAREIRAGLALSDAARRFASVDIPAGVLKDLGLGLTDTEIQDTLNRWETARRARTTGYVAAGLEYSETSMDPQRMQLIQARQQNAVEIARLVGLPASYVSAPMGEGNLTYQNVESQRRELIDVSCSYWIGALEQRLSMDDVTPHGTILRLDVDAFVRSTSEERWAAYQRAFSIVDPVTGERALTVQEIRDRETFTPPGPNRSPIPDDASALDGPQPPPGSAVVPTGPKSAPQAAPRLRQ